MATFRFTLRTPLTAVVFGTESVRNWQDVKPSIVKNKDYRGIFQTMTSTLEFTGVIRDLIIRTIDEYGYDAAIYLTIEIGNNNRERGSFQVFRGMENMIADISEIEITELAASLNFTESGFVADILSRGDMKANIDVTETIDGDPLPPYEGLLRTIHLHDRKLIWNSRLEAPKEYTDTYSGSINETIFKLVPLNIVYRSDSNFKTVIDQDAAGPGYLPDVAISAFYLEADMDREVSVRIRAKLSLTLSSPTDTSYGYALAVYKHSGGMSKRFKYLYRTAWYGGEDPNFREGTRYIDVDYSEVWPIEEGDSYELDIMVGTAGGSAGLIRDVTVSIDELFIEGTSLEHYPDTKSKSILPHELFQRLLHITTGTPDTFYSEYFGRTDLGYKKDGDGAYLATLNGLMLRGFPDDKTKYNTSLKDAFSAFSKEKNLVGTIDIVNGKQVFRVEPYEEIYTKHRAVKLGALSEVSRSIDFEKIFTSVTVGSADKEYEEVNGLYPFNGEFTFATPMKTTASELNLIGPYRKDDIGIELTRRQQYENDPNKDYRADKDIFIIDAAPTGYDPDSPDEPLTQPLLLANRGQDYITIEGIYEPSRAYNLNLSPGRQLRLWGNVIASGLLSKGPGGGKLKFVKGGKNQDLASHRQGEDEIVEAADVPIMALESPIVLPDIIMIAEADMTFDQYKQMAENTTSLVEFENKGVQIFAYIRSAEFDFERNVCNFELERANF